MRNINLNVQSLLQILLLALPFLILSGPLLSDLLVSIIAIYFIFNSRVILSDRQLNYFFFFLISFYILINISTFLSIYINLNLNSIFYFRFIFFAFCFIFIIKDPKFFFKYLSIILSCIFLVLLFDGLSEFFLKKNILNYDNKINNRVSSLFKDELILGSFSVRLMPILLGSLIFFLKPKTKYYDYIIAFFYLVSLSLILLSGERTSLVLFSAFSLFIFIFWETKKIFKFYLILLTPILLLLIFSETFKNRFIIEPLIQTNLISQNTFEKMNLIEKKDFQYPEYTKEENIFFFSIHHHRHYLSAWKIFKDNPLIGAGPKSFRVSCKEEKYRVYIFDEWKISDLIIQNWSLNNNYGNYDYLDLEAQTHLDKLYGGDNVSFGYLKLNNADLACSTHPHNTHIQILSELGLIGYIFLLIMIFLILFFAIKIKKNKLYFNDRKLTDLSIFLLGGCFMNLWVLSPSGNFFNNWLSILYYLPLGLVLYCFSQRQKKNEIR